MELDLTYHPKIIQQTLQAYQDLSNAPYKMICQPIFAARSLITSQLYNVLTPYGSRPINDYYLNLSEAATGKTTMFDILLEEIYKYQDERSDICEPEMDVFKSELKKWKENPVGLKPIAPEGHQYTTSKPTTNGLLNLLAKVPFLGLFSDDAGEFMSSYGMSIEKKIEMGSIQAKLWSGSDVERQTGMEESNVKIKNRRLTLLFMMQEIFAHILYNDPVMAQQGVLTRYLMTSSGRYVTPDLDGSIEGTKKTAELRLALDPWHVRVKELINKPRSYRKYETTYTIVNGSHIYKQRGVELAPKDLKWTPKAYELACSISNHYKNGSEPGEQYYNIEGFAKRTGEHLFRSAAQNCIIDLRDTITTSDVKAAHNEMKMYIHELLALDIITPANPNGVVEHCYTLVKFMQDKGLEETTEAYVISNLRKYKNCDQVLRDKILNEAESRNLIHVENKIINGKKSKKILLTKSSIELFENELTDNERLEQIDKLQGSANV